MNIIEKTEKIKLIWRDTDGRVNLELEAPHGNKIKILPYDGTPFYTKCPNCNQEEFLGKDDIINPDDYICKKCKDKLNELNRNKLEESNKTKKQEDIQKTPEKIVDKLFNEMMDHFLNRLSVLIHDCR